MRGPRQSGRESGIFEEVKEDGERLCKLWAVTGWVTETKFSQSLIDSSEGFAAPPTRNGRLQWVYSSGGVGTFLIYIL